MTAQALPKQSLKTRITVATLLIFLASLWSQTFYSSRILRQDMTRQLGEQQLATLAILAAQIDREIASRFAAVSRVAERAAPAMTHGPAAIQDYLDDRPILQTLFNDGLIVVDRQGIVVADSPSKTGRIGANLTEHDSIAAAIMDGRASVGQLAQSKPLGAPVFHITAPIRDARGEVISALSGVTNLGISNFLESATASNFGKSGRYLLIAPRQRRIIASTDHRPTSGALPGSDILPDLEHSFDGRDGQRVFVDPNGVEVLAAHQTIASTGWHVVALLPTAEAFAPLHEMQRRMIWAALLLTLLAGSLCWWILKRQFAPMRAATRALARMSASENTPSMLPVAHNDEIGQLIGGFNGLLSTLQSREQALRDSKTLHETLLSSMLAGVIIVDPATRAIESVNNAAAAMFGAPADKIIGRRCHAFLCPAAEHACPILDLGATVENAEKQLLCADGSRRTVLKSVSRIVLNGQEKLLECFVDINERKQAGDEIRRLAFYDPLTQLPNRRLLLDRLGQALAACARRQRRGALLYIDLDDFKTLNDTRGHKLGDQLLQQVARRLQECVRRSDTVARLRGGERVGFLNDLHNAARGDLVARFGGDEFIVMLDDLHGTAHEAAAQAKVVGDKILASLGASFDLAGVGHRCSASIGITLFADAQQGIDELLMQADVSMYQAKAGGRNTLRFYNQEMQDTINERAALEADLAAALTNEEFALHYQAQVNGDGRLLGAEALLRWQHPRRGAVSPGDFIPLAEDNGLIVPLGQWVLESACRQLAAWARHPATTQLTLAINVSARQLQQSDFVENVRSALARSGADPRRLKLEITESLLVTNIEETITKMGALKALGVGFALDDFGTGYSSLAYLKRLPLDQLKIDQGFVRDLLIDANDEAIARMIVALAGSLGLSVIAEGVENDAQRLALAHLGCHHYQGYLFSRPLPILEFERLARNAESAVQSAGNDAMAWATGAITACRSA